MSKKINTINAVSKVKNNISSQMQSFSESKKKALDLLRSKDYKSGKLTNADIQKKVGISHATLYRWLRDPEFQDLYIGSVKSDFVFGAQLAFNTLENLMLNAKSDNIRLNAAKEILDRAGLVKVEKSQSISLTKEMDEKEIRRAFFSLERQEMHSLEEYEETNASDELKEEGEIIECEVEVSDMEGCRK